LFSLGYQDFAHWAWIYFYLSSPTIFVISGYFCHLRASGDPVKENLDSRFRGKDKKRAERQKRTGKTKKRGKDKKRAEMTKKGACAEMTIKKGIHKYALPL